MMPELGVSDVNQAKSAPLSLHTGKYKFSAAGSLQEIILSCLCALASAFMKEFRKLMRYRSTEH